MDNYIDLSDSPFQLNSIWNTIKLSLKVCLQELSYILCYLYLIDYEIDIYTNNLKLYALHIVFA